jgi:hypothetical protein
MRRISVGRLKNRNGEDGTGLKSAGHFRGSDFNLCHRSRGVGGHQMPCCICRISGLLLASGIEDCVGFAITSSHSCYVKGPNADGFTYTADNRHFAATSFFGVYLSNATADIVATHRWSSDICAFYSYLIRNVTALITQEF